MGEYLSQKTWNCYLAILGFLKLSSALKQKVLKPSIGHFKQYQRHFSYH